MKLSKNAPAFVPFTIEIEVGNNLDYQILKSLAETNISVPNAVENYHREKQRTKFSDTDIHYGVKDLLDKLNTEL